MGGLMGQTLTKFLSNFFFLFIIYYLIYHTLYGNFNLQNYFVTKFEKKMFEDINYRLKQNIESVNKDIFALHYGFEDMVDEVTKRKNPLPVNGEVLVKLD